MNRKKLNDGEELVLACCVWCLLAGDPQGLAVNTQHWPAQGRLSRMLVRANSGEFSLV